MGIQWLKKCFLFPRCGWNKWGHVSFTIGIQTPMQLQSMILCGHNGTISMDATFGTNDVKFHLFTLMNFDAHHTGMLVAWIIKSCQKCEDLVEWLNPHRENLLSPMPKWKPYCFIVDDAPKELCTLRWILNSFHPSFVYSNVLMCTI